MKKFFALAVIFAATASFVGCEAKKVEGKKVEATTTKKDGSEVKETVEVKKEETAPTDTKEAPAPAPVEEKK